jgi:hypothetical protein
MFISGVNNTRDKLLTPPTNLSTVSLTPAKKFIGGVVDTGDDCSPVSLTLLKNDCW